jgi:hypothetical protein
VKIDGVVAGSPPVSSESENCSMKLSGDISLSLNGSYIIGTLLTVIINPWNTVSFKGRWNIIWKLLGFITRLKKSYAITKIKSR